MRQLKDTLSEIARVLKPGGRLVLALPCEGGFLWNFGREITTRRAFRKEFGLDYDKIIAYEHVHDLASVREHLRASQDLVQMKQRFFPSAVPQTDLNLIACFSLEKRS
jgi:SAM-dependent methyltransferase